MVTKLSSIVPQAVTDMPFREYLRRAYPLMGSGRIVRLVNAKQFRINGEKAQPDASVNGGDEVVLYADFMFDRSLDTIFDDGRMVAFVKLAGLPVDADNLGIGEDTVLSRLRLVNPCARLVHRLDTQTSGVMLAAYDDDTERLLVYAFKQHLLKRTDYALCAGRFSRSTGSIISYISKDSSAARVTVSRYETENGLQAKSEYRIVKEYSKDGINMSLLEVTIETGRTHQIRAQLSSIGHPIIGDDKYGDHSTNKTLGIREMCLASREIRFGSDTALGSYAGKSFICPKEKIKWLTAEM